MFKKGIIQYSIQPAYSNLIDVLVVAGGGSGGGIVMIFHKGNLSNLGTISVNGGLGGARPTGFAGGKGGDGHKETIHY